MALKLSSSYNFGDPNFGDVSLLLRADGSPLRDSSPDPKVITAVGNAAYSTAQAKFGSGSIAFDGNGDYLTCGTNAGYAMGTGDFTLEGFVYVTSFTNPYQTIFRTREGAVNSTTGYSIGVLGTGTPLGSQSFFFYTNGIVVTANNTVSLNTWHHVACTRSGSTLRLFIDGVQGVSATNSQNFTDSTGFIGAVFSTQEFFNGYIDELRITKGVARYTANFTPPTAPFPDFYAPPVDPNFENVSLLLHGDESSIIDSSRTPKAITVVGNAAYSTVQKKFGSGSIVSVSDGTDYLSIPPSTSLQLSSESDFTVECWVYLLSNRTYNHVVSKGGQNTREWALSVGPTNLQFYWSTNGLSDGDTVIARASTLPLNTWIHVAAVKVGNTIKLFKDGVQQGADGTFTTIYNGNGTTWVGRFMDFTGISHSLHGYIDDLRITKGIARYQSSFTPPTYAFPHPKQSWTPARIPTALWLDASDASTITTVSGAVSEWRDKSGNNRHFTQSNSSYRPLLQTSTVVFDGVDDFLTRGTMLFTSPVYGFYTVTRNRNLSANPGIGGQLSYGGGDLTTYRHFLYQNATNYYSAIQVGDYTVFLQPYTGDTNFHIFSYEHNGSTISLHSEAGLTTTQTNGGYNGIAQTAFTLGAGAPLAPGSVFVPLDAREVIATPTPLSASDRQKLQGYLAHKWGLTANLPNNHPYKYEPPYI